VPCLRSETGSAVDARPNSVDHSSARKEATHAMNRAEAPAPQGPSSGASPAAAPPDQPAPRREQRSNGYSR
jgi:hypothetical protein